MAFDISKVKTQVRRIVHQTFGVPAFYKDSSLSAPVPVTARWHSKIDRFGDLDQQGYAELIQGIDRVIFSAHDARRINVQRGGIIMFPSLGAGLGVALGAPLDGEGIAPPGFILQDREPPNGPYEEVWNVTRKETK